MIVRPKKRIINNGSTDFKIIVYVYLDKLHCVIDFIEK